MNEVDACIVGGGVIGLVLAKALHDRGYRVLLLEQRSSSGRLHDTRSIALSRSSLNILNHVGLLSLIPEMTDIQSIHVSQKGSWGHTCLKEPAGLALGAVVSWSDLVQACDQAVDDRIVLRDSKVLAHDPARGCLTFQDGLHERRCHAGVTIVADGGGALLRTQCRLPMHEKNYHQIAWVATLQLKRSHEGCAYERFTSDGPIACLPLPQDRVGCVWVHTTAKAEAIKSYNDEAFLEALQAQFGYRLGRFVSVSGRQAYPLYQKIMPHTVLHQTVFLGNAAHTLHPIAGQGMNLGLRDAAMLITCLSEKGLHPEALSAYQKKRSRDEVMISKATDHLLSLFGHWHGGAPTLRGLGLMCLDQSAFLKDQLSYYASGYGGASSALYYDLD